MGPLPDVEAMGVAIEVFSAAVLRGCTAARLH
jgi:hypothetical protein